MVNYIIEYTVTNKIGVVLKNGIMRVKNKKTEIGAKVGLENYLEKKYKDFHTLVIHSCKLENPIDAIMDSFRKFQ